MDHFEENQQNFKHERNNEVFDPNDLWDQWLVKTRGSIDVLDDPDEQERKSELTGDELIQAQYQNAISNSEGDIIDPDDEHFGSWGITDGELQIEAPENIPTPEEMEKWMDGSLRIRVDDAIHFQADGPSTEGHIWQARLFDQITGKEVPNTRVLGNKLSWVIGAVMKHLPPNANEYIPIEQFLSDTLQSAFYTDQSIEEEERHQKAVTDKYPDFPKRDLTNEIMSADEKFSNIFMEGSMEDYVNRTIESIKKISNKDEQMEAARKFKKDFHDLQKNFSEVFRNIQNDKYKFLGFKGEPVSFWDFLENPGDDETDGWMKPPDWRK